MITYHWTVDPTCILTRGELQGVLSDLARRSCRSANARLNLVIVRLACCCGLRASEIGGLLMKDVRIEAVRPHIYVPARLAKGGHARRVPLWWDRRTLADLSIREGARRDEGAGPDDPFVCSVNRNTAGRRYGGSSR